MKQLLPLLAVVALSGAATPAASPPSDALAKMALWEGHWTYSGQIYETKYLHYHSDSGLADCHWATGRNYMICDYFSNDPPHEDLSIITYSPSANAYKRIGVAKNSDPVRETFAIDGDTWTTQSTTQDRGKTLLMRTVFVFVTPGKQTTTVQVSADNGQTWTKIIEVTAVKS